MMIEKFCHDQTDGFMVSKIKSNLEYDPKWEHPPLSKEEEKVVLNRLDQNYTYLKCGGQCYAFISDDRKTILKFFKLHRMEEVKWLSKLESLPDLINPNRLRIFRYRKKRFQHIFGSCKIAYEEMKEETALIYSHLNKTDHLHKKVRIRDKLGIYHLLDMDKMEFLLQEKVILPLEKFKALKEQNDIYGAHRCIDSILHHFLMRYEKGIDDSDPIVRKNFGFIENRAVELDLGSYSKKESLKDPANYIPQLEKEIGDFKNWLQNNFPELSPYLEEKIFLLKENVR